MTGKLLTALILFCSCNNAGRTVTEIIKTDTIISDTVFIDTPNKPGLQPPDTPTYTRLDDKAVPADSILSFAYTLIGTPYLYASMDPQKGFDCSGFINYVFNHFKINVPRSSRDFENFGKTVPLYDVRKGDIILFTGTDSLIRIIGHIGIVTSTDGGVTKFIHSTSGKAHAVTVSTLDVYYQRRFMRVARLPEVI